MSNQVFNKKFSTLQDGIKQFINNLFNNKQIILKLNRDLTFDNGKDAEKVDELIELLFNTDTDFAEYFMSNYQYEPDMKLEMVIFCNEWLSNNYGEEQILNWKKFNEPYYVVSMTAYVYIQSNKDWLLEILNDNKNNTANLK